MTTFLLCLLACGPSAIVLDDGKVGTDPAADDTGTDTGADTGTGGDTDTGTDTDTGADTDTGGDTDDPDPAGAVCLEYGVITDEGGHLVYGTTVDSYDSRAGAYGDGNVGAAATVASNAGASCALTSGATVQGEVFAVTDPMAAYCEEWGAAVSGGLRTLPGPATLPTVPSAMLGASEGDLTVGWDEVTELDGTHRVGALDVQYGGTLAVTADTALVVDSLDVAGTLTVASGATLTLWVLDNATVQWGGLVNAAGTPDQLVVWMDGGTFALAYGGTLAARLYGPDTAWTQGGTFSGLAAVETWTTEWGAATHVDVAGLCP